ncbi:AMP-binding protein [Microbacterium sp. SYP-A9085]|nr:AMP-binding protein [Microbacterium sp. SYP-A9085]
MVPGTWAPADEPHTIGRWLDDRAAASPGKTAIDDRGVTIDYRRLHERAAALASLFVRSGYGPGDRIATLSGNSIDHVVAFFACVKIGVAFVPLSWRLTAAELAAVVDRADPQLILVEEEYAGLASDAISRTRGFAPTAMLGVAGVETHVPSRSGSSGPATAARAVRDDDPALVIFTSGSEGTPKGVVLTHANCFWNNLALDGVVQLTASDVVLCALPQFHVAAWNVQPLLAWWAGATVVLERSFQPDRILQLIPERGVSALMGVPTQYRLLADDVRFPASDLSSLRIAQVGGAPLDEDLRGAWRIRGVELLAGYGLTEAGPNVLTVTAGEGDAAAGTVGAAYPHVDVCIADPATGLPLGAGAIGELWVRGPSVFAGYLGDAAESARARCGEWLRTGDLARRDGSGRYRIVDRVKDIYISGGENIAPAEVERALCTHPHVQAAVAVGVPDRVWGERGVAFVELRPGAACSEDELIAHARDHLASFKVPVRIVPVDELPRSAIDKFARSRLRERARALIQEGSHEHAG